MEIPHKGFPATFHIFHGTKRGFSHFDRDATLQNELVLWRGERQVARLANL